MTNSHPHLATTRVLAHGHQLPAALGLLSISAATQLLLPRYFPLPGIFTQIEVNTTATVFAAVGFALALTQICTEPAPLLAATSPRGWVRLRASRLLISAAVTAAVTIGTAPPDTTAISSSCLLLFTAEALAVSTLAGSGMAWSLPLTHVIAASVFGIASDGIPYPWAYFIDTHTTAPELLASTLALTLAGLVWALHHPRPA